MFGTDGFISKRCIQKYRLFRFLFSDYRHLPVPEVTLLSPETALDVRFRLGKAYLFGYGELRPKKRNASKTGNDVIIFSASFQPRHVWYHWICLEEAFPKIYR